MGTKNHIMDSAMELFAEKGFQSTSVRDIASLANANVALINYHFGSKEGLLKEIMEKRALQMQVRIREISENNQINELDKIFMIIEQYIDKLFTHHAFHKVIFFELFTSVRSELHENTIDIFSGNYQIVSQIIQKGIRKKIFRKVDPDMCFSSIIGTLHHFMHSNELRIKLFSQDKKTDPLLEPSFKKRVTKHIQQMMEHHLIADLKNKE
jgi:AcrR family transcriptional regulator